MPHNSQGNLITDVAGVMIGHSEDEALASGATVALFDRETAAAVAVLGGGPAGRDQECLALESSVEKIHAIVFSGGSGYGLDAASGVQAFLREQGRGFPVGPVLVPIVPQAICFDLLNGGDKNWGRYPPYRELAYEACRRAAKNFALGSVGAGYGATTADLKGGVGSASIHAASGHCVAALAVVNAIGSAVIDGGPHFWAAPWERGAEYGGLGAPEIVSLNLLRKGHVAGTTLALIATDAALTKAQCRRLALSASGGLARGLRFAQAPLDGDTIFAAATGALGDKSADLTELGALACDCLARAIARGVFAATALPFDNALPAWRDLFGERD